MSSCFKCGRELPAGQVECEDDDHLSPSLSPKGGEGEGHQREPRLLVIALEVALDPKKIVGHEDEINRMVKRMGELMAEAVEQTGLAEFLKPQRDAGPNHGKE